jgi:hypothetical protein
MRSVLLAIAFVFVFVTGAMAQFPRVNATDNGVVVEFAPIVGSGATPWQRVFQYGITQHTLVVTAIGGVPSQLSVNLECSRDGSTVESVLGNISTPFGGTVQSVTGFCPYVRANVSSPDVQTVIPVYIGAVPTAVTAVPTFLSPNSGGVLAVQVSNKLLLPCNALRRTNCQ